MDVYILDSEFNKVGVLDKYSSLIWTDRFASYGDFKLKIDPREKYADKLVRGGYLSNGLRSMEEYGRELMRIETVEKKAGMLNVSGRSLVSFLLDRVIGSALNIGSYDYDNGGLYPPRMVLYELVNNACNAALMHADDKIPHIYVVSHATDTPVIDVVVKGGTVYQRVKETADAYDIGFSMYYKRDPSWADGIYNIVFDSYFGVNRTSQQLAVPEVIFGESLDTLTNTTELLSEQDYKNVAYVFGKDLSISIGIGDGARVTGFDRRVLAVEATDITGTTTKARENLTNRGIAELKKYNRVNAFDGELVLPLKYVYGVDYFMGDIVELRSASGTKSFRRVTEFIRASDASGERSFPTLTEIDE